jgi:serine/threonine protein kinase/Tol biopolymer transport system component
MSDIPLPDTLLFGPFELDPSSGELRKRGRKVRLPEQAIQILTMLVEQPGQIVTREEIRRRLWPNGTLVEFDHSINTAVKKLRVALGDSAEVPRYIETLARRGYRLVVPVERVSSKRAPIADSSYAETSPPIGDLSGRLISHYRILNILGGGAMGLVYRAEDLKLGRSVALKFLPDELREDQLAIGRLRREACAASALTHPNICTVYAIEEEAGHPFIVMELLEGHTIRQRIAQTALSIEETIELGIQIADALHGAHQHGIIHRDIKPANIFITDRGQAKILDFGVAKLTGSPRSVETTEARAVAAASGGTAAMRSDLTRTGVRMGTAAYMSPEQIRGEPLDNRTDLFSFGLVLYEMATGRQAFEQQTLSLLHDAILNREPVPVREVNPQTPVELARVIDRAIEKDRTLRWQSAGQMRDELIRLRDCTNKERKPAQYGLAAASALMVVAVVSVAILRHPSVPTPARVNQWTQRRLTNNSSDNPIRGAGQISPDAKYLAYADRLGIHLQTIRTGERTTIPEPADFDAKQFYWSIAAWFPSSKEFLVNSRPAAEDAHYWSAKDASIWAVSFTGPPRKIRENAEAFSVSPDGNWIAFGTQGSNLGDDHELWLMNAKTERAHKLVETSENHLLEGFQWSRDGRYVLYADKDKDVYRVVSRDMKGSSPVLISSWPVEQIGPYVLWLRDGRLLYIVDEPGSPVTSNNLWEQHVDPYTGRALDRPTKLTNWAGFGLDSLSASSDSRHLAFTRWNNQQSVLIGALPSAGSKSFDSSPLTMTEGWNTFVDWTRDSRVVLFISDKDGRWQLFRQTVGLYDAQAVVGGEPFATRMSTLEGQHLIAGGALGARTSPDGKWVLYLANSDTKHAEVMRVPQAGGTPEAVSSTSADATLSCSRMDQGSCVIAERTPDQKEIIFSELSPMSGRGPALARIAASPELHPWALSPDGSMIALHGERSNHFDLISTKTGRRSSLEVHAGSMLGSISWSPRGDSLYVSALSNGEALIVCIGLNGNTRVIWREPGDFGLFGVPSPDGRLLAVTRWRNSSNVWMIDNF